MGYYNNATICLNGHEISGYTANFMPHCEKCGEKTISYCEHCGQPIHGKYENDGIVAIGFKYKKPYYCWSCGEPYPWTQRILDNAIEILSLDESINESEREIIRLAIPNLIVDTPESPVAIAKYSKGMKNAAEFVKNGMRQLLIDVVSETVKRSLFG